MIPLTLISLKSKLYFMRYKFRRFNRIWRLTILVSFGCLFWIWGEFLTNLDLTRLHKPLIWYWAFYKTLLYFYCTRLSSLALWLGSVRALNAITWRCMLHVISRELLTDGNKISYALSYIQHTAPLTSRSLIYFTKYLKISKCT